MELTLLVRRATFGAMAVGSLAIGAPNAEAQEAGPATECAAGGGAAYRHCALWLDGRRVKRGAEGAIVAEPGFFSPLRLTRVVRGDSAVAEAGRFERNTHILAQRQLRAVMFDASQQRGTAEFTAPPP